MSNVVVSGDPSSGGSKIVFSDYIVGTTNNPSTNATSSGSAPVLAEMTKTFTPEDASNKIEVFFSGTFSNNEKKQDRGARAAIFVDGVFQEETERRSFVYRDEEYHGNISTFWQGSMSAASHTITVRFWGDDDTTIGEETMRNMLIKEIDE